MAGGPPVVVHFKEVPNSDKVREAIETRCEHLASEFDEVTRLVEKLEADSGMTREGVYKAREDLEEAAPIQREGTIDALERAFSGEAADPRPRPR